MKQRKFRAYTHQKFGNSYIHPTLIHSCMSAVRSSGLKYTRWIEDSPPNIWAGADGQKKSIYLLINMFGSIIWELASHIYLHPSIKQSIKTQLDFVFCFLAYNQPTYLDQCQTGLDWTGLDWTGINQVDGVRTSFP